jgi:hypothetical protein
MYLFARGGVPVIGLPIANHDDNQNAANENLRLPNLWDGIEIYAALLPGCANSAQNKKGASLAARPLQLRALELRARA